MPKTAQQLASNRRYMARRRASPETNAILRASAKKCWENGGGTRQAQYLAELKRKDFFKWKARRSYIMLSAEELKRLWQEQGGKCGLTGIQLDGTAELDHILPISKGGDNSYENSRWLCRDVNQAKHKLTDEEFFEICRLVTQSKAYTEWIGKQLIKAHSALYKRVRSPSQCAATADSNTGHKCGGGDDRGPGGANSQGVV